MARLIAAAATFAYGVALLWLAVGTGRVPALGAGLPAPSATPAARQDGSPDDRFDFVGSAACRMCHRRIFLSWSATPHARADAVVPEDQRFDPDCQRCHAPADTIESAVGCEACHGPGSAYSALAVMIDPLKRTQAGLQDGRRCVACHNPGHPFHVERDLEAALRLVHPTQE